VSADNAEWVTSGSAEGFGSVVPADDLYHGTGPEGDSLTETWFWGFNVPDVAINCYVYCWVHPNLGVVSAGLIIYQGIKRQHLAAEVFDMPMFLSAATVVGDGRDIEVPNGLRMEVVEPLEHVHMTFSDPGRETEVDVHMKAVAPPVVRANGKHFEQVMHTTGTLVLRGERHDVDSYTVRDRSWGELRPEGHNPAPPYNWVTGVTEDGAWAFNVGSHDDPTLDPHWAADFDVAPEKAFKDGWVWRDGRAIRLARSSKRTERDMSTLRPTRYVLTIEDTEGEELEITGEVVAGVPWGGWHNIACHLALVKWDVAGRTAWGESMDVQWNDYVWRYGQTEADASR